MEAASVEWAGLGIAGSLFLAAIITLILTLRTSGQIVRDFQAIVRELRIERDEARRERDECREDIARIEEGGGYEDGART